MGTVLQEALLRGFQVIGRDRDDTAVAAARQNLAWLLKTYRLPAGRLRSIEPLDVRSLGRHFRAGSVDAIVTEGALGPPLRQIASENLKRRYIGKLSHLYLAAFEQYRRVLCPQGTVVTTFPYYRGPGPKRDFLPVLDRIKQLGYNLVDLFSPAVVEVCHCQATERGTLLYERSGQFVGREVAVFKK
jgi:tRNA G10  N-methylase Trm11